MYHYERSINRNYLSMSILCINVGMLLLDYEMLNTIKVLLLVASFALNDVLAVYVSHIKVYSIRQLVFSTILHIYPLTFNHYHTEQFTIDFDNRRGLLHSNFIIFSKGFGASSADLL